MKVVKDQMIQELLASSFFPCEIIISHNNSLHIVAAGSTCCKPYDHKRVHLMKNYYQILGINPSATKEEIKEAYVKLSKKIHPDMNSGDNFFTELFKSINEAYQVLSDEDQRSAYNIKFNSYLYDFTYIKEKEQELNKREAVIVSSGQKRKIFFRGLFSLLAGICVVTVFSFAFDKKPYEEETFADRSTQPSHIVNAVQSVPTPKTDEKTNFAKAQTVVVKPSAIQISSQPVEPPKKSEALPKAKIQVEIEAPKTLAAKIEETKIIADPQSEIVQSSVNLSDERMEKIVHDLLQSKNKNHKNANCVRIIKSESSNVENAFKLAQVLRTNGFVLAGRETTTRKINGIQINYTGNFITITVGSI